MAHNRQDSGGVVRTYVRQAGEVVDDLLRTALSSFLVYNVPHLYTAAFRCLGREGGARALPKRDGSLRISNQHHDLPFISTNTLFSPCKRPRKNVNTSNHTPPRLMYGKLGGEGKKRSTPINTTETKVQAIGPRETHDAPPSSRPILSPIGRNCPPTKLVFQTILHYQVTK